jgi:predicted nucleic acid-binding protein
VLLFDTSFLIELEAEVSERRFGPARQCLHAHRSVPYGVSVVSIGEFAEGFDNPLTAEPFLARFRVINVFPLIAYRMAIMQNALPQRLGENDAWIAATALYYGARLVGREKAFKRVPGLKYLEI